MAAEALVCRNLSGQRLSRLTLQEANKRIALHLKEFTVTAARQRVPLVLPNADDVHYACV